MTKQFWLDWVRNVGSDEDAFFALIGYIKTHPEERRAIQEACMWHHGNRLMNSRDWINRVLSEYNPRTCRNCCFYLVCKEIYTTKRISEE